MTTSYTSEDILRELQNRQIQEYHNQIQVHKQAINRLEEQLAAHVAPSQFLPPQKAPETEEQARNHHEPKQQFGPCATTLLELIEALKQPVSETELLRCTKYTKFMFRKAISELVADKKIVRVGDARKPLFRRYTESA